MATIEGVGKVLAHLKRLARESAKKYSSSVTVGFTQHYALPVHEMTWWKHRVGQAKFLEQPFRQFKAELIKLIRRAVLNGATMDQALLIAGLRIQREAQLLTPVDTGALKASAFTTLTRDVEVVAARAYKNAERLRAKVLAKRERDKAKAAKN